MGHLVTATIYMDGIDEIRENPKDFVEKLHSAACRGREATFGVGSHCNLVSVQKVRHADDKTVYVHAGNCVTEVNAYNQDFEDLMDRCPEFADELIKTMENQLKKVKALKKSKKVTTAPR